MRQVKAAIGMLVLAACGGGGGSPTSGGVTPPTPTPRPTGWPAGTTVELVDGGAGQTVSAPIVVAGATVPAGAPLASAASEGATVDVSVSGFLPRQTIVRTGETRLVLWPDSATLPGDYTRSLVYTSGAASPGSEILDALRRLPSRLRSVAVMPSAGIQSDPDAMDAHRAAIDGINGATVPIGVTYRLGGNGDLAVPTNVDAADSACAERTTRAVTRMWLSGTNEITRAEIVFCGTAIAATLGTVVHELGHTMGLRHSLDRNDTMYPFAGSLRSPTLTSREALTMSLMRTRRSGTLWPDNDRDAGGAAAQRVVTVID